MPARPADHPAGPVAVPTAQVVGSLATDGVAELAIAVREPLLALGPELVVRLANDACHREPKHHLGATGQRVLLPNATEIVVHGRIAARGAPGTGTTISIALPAARPTQPTPAVLPLSVPA